MDQNPPDSISDQSVQISHPYRSRSWAYTGTLLGLFAANVVIGALSIRVDQSSELSKQLSAESVFLLFAAITFTIPFIIYAIKYWFEKSHVRALPPADDKLHSISVTYSRGVLFKYFLGPFMGRSGQLSWVNSSQDIKLLRGETVVFDVLFKDVQKIELNINQLVLKVNGHYYNFYANTMLVGAGMAAVAAVSVESAIENTARNERLGGAAALATMVAGWERLERAGIPELAERMKMAGVKTVITKVGRTFEYAFDLGFVLLILLSLIVSFGLTGR